MASAGRSINIVIESTRATKDLPVRHIVRVLNEVQTSIYHIGDYLASEDFRVRGPPDDMVRDKCEMIFKDVRKGSFYAELILQDPQTTLSNQQSLGEDSLQKFSKLITEINNEDAGLTRVKETIDEPHHRYRIVGDLDRLWPSETDGFNVILTSPQMKSVLLNPDKKFFIRQLLKGDSEEEEFTVRGVISDLHIKKDIIRIDGPDGSIKIPYESVDKIKEFINKPIAISGKAEPDAAGNITELNSVYSIELFKHTTIKRILSQKGELQLVNPMVIDIDYRNKNWVMKNDEFRIMISDAEYANCLKQFNDEIFFIWSEYGPIDNSHLSPSALRLKNSILSIVKEKPIG